MIKRFKSLLNHQVKIVRVTLRRTKNDFTQLILNQGTDFLHWSIITYINKQYTICTSSQAFLPKR